MRSLVACCGALVLDVYLAGCGSAPRAPDDAATDTPAAVADAATDAPALGGPPAALAWARGPAVPTARDHHATFVVDTASAHYLYVAGGFVGNTLLTSVVRTPIQGDGSLGAWESVTPLPHPVSGMGVVVTHGEVVLTGGFQTRSTMLATIAGDGSLGAWTLGPALPGIRFHAAAVTYGDFVYVVGGIAGTDTVDDVARAPFMADGTLGAWQVVAHLPYTLSHEACAVVGSTLYVIGGSTGDTNNNTAVDHREVWTAALGADGSVGPFVAAPAFPTNIVTHASFTYGGYLYAAGGLTSDDAAEANDTITANVWRAPLAADGSLGAWVLDPSPLPIARSHAHHMPIWGNHVYSAAGAGVAQTALDDVFVGTLQ